MRFKYQLRGLGIGVIMTAALLMVGTDNEKVSAKADDTIEMTTSAEEVLLTEDDSKAEESSELEETSEVETIEEDTPLTSQQTDRVIEITVPEETQEQVSKGIEINTEPMTEKQRVEIIPAKEEETTEEGSSVAVESTGEVVSITIVGGDDSGTVARKLYTAGLVENPTEFDAYLMQHGYDKKISVGTVEIAKGAGWLEIAEKISGKK